MSAGSKMKTVIMLITMPFASAVPRSLPRPKRMNTSARKPITVVSPLDMMLVVDLQRASVIASRGEGSSSRHSAKRWMRKTE